MLPILVTVPGIVTVAKLGLSRMLVFDADYGGGENGAWNNHIFAELEYPLMLMAPPKVW